MKLQQGEMKNDLVAFDQVENCGQKHVYFNFQTLSLYLMLKGINGIKLSCIKGKFCGSKNCSNSVQIPLNTKPTSRSVGGAR